MYIYTTWLLNTYLTSSKCYDSQWPYLLLVHPSYKKCYRLLHSYSYLPAQLLTKNATNTKRENGVHDIHASSYSCFWSIEKMGYMTFWIKWTFNKVLSSYYDHREKECEGLLYCKQPCFEWNSISWKSLTLLLIWRSLNW